MKKRVFISHPFLGKRQNLEAIKHICKALVPFNIIPISPVLAFSFMNDQVAEERGKALDWAEELIEVVDAVFLCGAWETSEGCRRERDAALMLMKPVYIIDGWRDGVPFWRGAEPKWFNYKERLESGGK